MGTYILISVLILITCILLVLIVLAQNAKGGGLSSSFGGSGANQQVMGVKKTSDFLEKTTWTLAIILLILSLTSSFVIPRPEHQEAQQSELQGMVPAQDAGPVDFSSPGDDVPEEATRDEQDLPVETPIDEQAEPVELPTDEPED